MVPLGVLRYACAGLLILRPTDDPNYVMIDIEFDSASEAEAVHGALREPTPVWSQSEVMHSPQARIVEAVESKEY